MPQPDNQRPKAEYSCSLEQNKAFETKRVLLAPDSFKGTLTAAEAAMAMQEGVLAALPGAICIRKPMADGGEGTLDVLVEALGGTKQYVDTVDALGRPTRAAFGLLEQSTTAIVELAAASGLHHIGPAERTPHSALGASTYGTGQLCLAAIQAGAREMYLTLGGSATTDGGFGLLAALGARYFDANGCQLDGVDARNLMHVHRVDVTHLHPGFFRMVFHIACDVVNVLNGPEGSAAVYGPQKGLDEFGVSSRDAELRRWCELLCETAMVEGLGADRWEKGQRDEAQIHGIGAAGGSALPLVVLSKAHFTPGAQLVAKAINLETNMEEVDWVITGEGCTDFQSLAGKVPAFVAQCAFRRHKPCFVVSGQLGFGHERLKELGVSALLQAAPSGDHSWEEIKANAYSWLKTATTRFLLGQFRG